MVKVTNGAGDVVEYARAMSVDLDSSDGVLVLLDEQQRTVAMHAQGFWSAVQIVTEGDAQSA